MGLDLHTIFVLFSILALMFSGLLVLAGLHAGGVKGVKQWAFANLSIGIGLGAAHFYNAHTPDREWALVFAATLIAFGIGLQYTGIKAFKNTQYDWRILLLIVAFAFSQNLWFTVLRPDVIARSISNSLFFAIVYAACARELLIKIKPPLKTAYWFTGISFAVFSVLMWIRVIAIAGLQPEAKGLFVDLPLNQASFFLGSMVQLCVIFGFVLMLNYRLVSELEKVAARDVLTGAFNRRSLEEEAKRLMAHSLRTGNTLTLMMIDIDDFKLINDKYGHPAGDEVLRRLVSISQASIRTDDYLARYGGEEFTILLPSTTEKDAVLLAERLRVTYQEADIVYMGEKLNSTISVGVADSAVAGLSIPTLISAADQALYLAKQTGKNRVAAYSLMDEYAKASGNPIALGKRTSP